MTIICSVQWIHWEPVVSLYVSTCICDLYLCLSPCRPTESECAVITEQKCEPYYIVVFNVGLFLLFVFAFFQQHLHIEYYILHLGCEIFGN